MSTQGGPWTRHGHDIVGVTVEGPGRPPRARCGGPGLCGKCSFDARPGAHPALMAASPPCIHEMPAFTCVDCRPRELEPTWPAQFEGMCRQPQCLKVIDKGELVMWNREGTHVVHARHG